MDLFAGVSADDSGWRLRAKSQGPIPIAATIKGSEKHAAQPWGRTARAACAPVPAASGGERRNRIAIAAVTGPSSIAVLHRTEVCGSKRPPAGHEDSLTETVGHVTLLIDEGSQITCTTLVRHDFKGKSYFLLFVGTSNGTVVIADANENGRVLVVCQLPQKPPGKHYSVVDGHEPIVAICATTASNASLRNPWVALGDEGGTPVGGGGQMYTRSVDVLHRSGWIVTIYEEQLDLLLSAAYSSATATLSGSNYQRPNMARDYEAGHAGGTQQRFPCSGIPAFTASLSHGYLLMRCEDGLGVSWPTDGSNDLGAVSACAALLHAPGISPLEKLDASISAKHQRLVVVVGRTIGMYSLQTKPAAALSGSKAALEVAGRLTGAAVRAVKGFWGGGGSKSGGRNDPAAPYLTTLGSVGAHHSLPLVGVDIQSVTMSPTAHYAALISATDRVYIVDAVSGTICNVLKGCRQVDVQWVTVQATPQSPFATLLAVYFSLRGVVEFHSIAQAQRVAACRTGTGLQLARVEGPGGHAPELLLLSPDATTEWRVRLRFARHDAKHRTNDAAANKAADDGATTNAHQARVATTPHDFMAALVRQLASRRSANAGSVVADALQQQARGWLQVLNARDTSMKLALRIRDNIVEMLFAVFQSIAGTVVMVPDSTTTVVDKRSGGQDKPTASATPPPSPSVRSIVDGANTWSPNDVRDALASVCDAWTACVGAPHAREEHCTPLNEAPTTRAQKFHVIQQVLRGVDLYIMLNEALTEARPSPPPSPAPEDAGAPADAGATSSVFTAVSSLLRGSYGTPSGDAGAVSWKSTFAQAMSRLTLSDERTIYAMPHGIDLWKDALQQFERHRAAFHEERQATHRGAAGAGRGNPDEGALMTQMATDAARPPALTEGTKCTALSMQLFQRFLRCFSFQQHGIQLTRRHEEALRSHVRWTPEADDVAAIAAVCYGGVHGVLSAPLVARQAPLMAELGIAGATAAALLLGSCLSVPPGAHLPLLTMHLSDCDPAVQSANVGHLREVLKLCPLRSVVEATGTVPLPLQIPATAEFSSPLNSTPTAANSPPAGNRTMWLHVGTRLTMLGLRASMDGEKAAHRAEAVRMVLRLVAHARLMDACVPLGAVLRNAADGVDGRSIGTIWTRCCESSTEHTAPFRAVCPLAASLCAVGGVASVLHDVPPDAATTTTTAAIGAAVGAWCLASPPSPRLIRTTCAALWMQGLTMPAPHTTNSSVPRWPHTTPWCTSARPEPQLPTWSLQTFQRVCVPCCASEVERPSAVDATEDDNPLLHAAVLWSLARDLLAPQRRMVLDINAVRSKDTPPNVHDMGMFMSGAGQRAMESYLKAAAVFVADTVDALHKALLPLESDELAARMTPLVQHVLVTEEDGEGNAIALFPRYDPSLQIAIVDFDGFLAQHAYQSDGVLMSLLDVQALCDFLQWCVAGVTFGQHHCDLLRTVPWSDMFAVPSFRCLGRDAVYPQLAVELHASMAQQRHEERMLFVGSVVHTMLQAHHTTGEASRRAQDTLSDVLDALRRSIRSLGDALQLRDLACDCATDCGTIAHILRTQLDRVGSDSSSIVRRILGSTPFRSICATVALLFLRRFIYTAVKWYASLEKGIPADNKEARTRHSAGSIRLRSAMSSGFQSWLREKQRATDKQYRPLLHRNGTIDAQFFFVPKEDDVAVDTLFRQCAGEGRLAQVLSAMRAVSDLVQDGFAEQSTDQCAAYVAVVGETTSVIRTIQSVLLPSSS